MAYIIVDTLTGTDTALELIGTLKLLGLYCFSSAILSLIATFRKNILLKCGDYLKSRAFEYNNPISITLPIIYPKDFDR